MPDINTLKKIELDEIIDFYYFIQDNGHIFYDNTETLNIPFGKILEGINEIRTIIENNYSR